MARRFFLCSLIALSTSFSQASFAEDAYPSYDREVVTIPGGAGYVLPDGSIAEGGAKHVHYIVERLNKRFTHDHPNIHFRDLSRGTTSAIPLLTYGKILFGSMGRDINELEKNAYQKIANSIPLEIRIAHTSDDTSQDLATSLAVYVNRANPLTKLTRQQLVQIMSVGNADGDYSTWGQVGLTGEWKNRRIHPYGTPEYTGFGSYMQREQLGGKALPSSYEYYNDTDHIIKRLEADPASIAVAALGRETGALRQVAIAENISESYSMGSRDDVQNGRYVLGRYLYFYVRKLPGEPVDPLVKEYLKLALSRDGQAIIASQNKGYIPLTPAEARAELAKID